MTNCHHKLSNSKDILNLQIEAVRQPKGANNQFTMRDVSNSELF